VGTAGLLLKFCMLAFGCRMTVASALRRMTQQFLERNVYQNGKNYDF
jgi:hypothetical protein